MPKSVQVSRYCQVFRPGGGQILSPGFARVKSSVASSPSAAANVAQNAMSRRATVRFPLINV
ncbi:hypothetical protein GGP80_003266 [Salinibacter ruber]|nr:hypothetical protein [Salinibacter ruber]MCS4047621.1 hypothetical protein [Salinibacter ruber]